MRTGVESLDGDCWREWARGMPRPARSLVGGYPYHIFNRANGRSRLFKKKDDFAAFDAVIRQTLSGPAWSSGPRTGDGGVCAARPRQPRTTRRF